MIGYLKLGGLFAGVIGLLLIGWKISQWRTDAQETARLRVELTAAQDNYDMEKAERERIDGLRAVSDAKLLDLQEHERTLSDALKAKVATVVVDRRDCDLGDGVRGLLNNARGYDGLPRAAKRGANIPETFTADKQ